MKELKNILTIVLIIVSNALIAQTVELPDTNLRNKLMSSYPLMIQGGRLDTIQAGNYIGVLNLSASNITDATGIEYFKNIHTIFLSNNKLTFLPDISKLTKLVNFYASNNSLEALPDFSTLVALQDFQVMNNKLKIFPELNAPDLKRIYCSDNQLKEFPSLEKFPNLEKLVIGGNPIENVLDYSQCEKLDELHVHKMNLNFIQGLNKLSFLKVLYAWGNNITDVSGLNDNTLLEKCYLYDNAIDQLPKILNKPGLVELVVRNNNLTFEEIVPIIEQGPPTKFEYAPQNNIPINAVIVREFGVLNMNYPVSNALGSNTYKWIKDGETISSLINWSNPAVAFSDSGAYYLRVSNNRAPLLTLNSDTFIVEVFPCLEVKSPAVNILRVDCSNGYGVDFSNSDIDGGTLPFSYYLFDGFKKVKILDEQIEIPAGNYTLTVVDANKCEDIVGFKLDKIKGCDPVFSPNGDGVADSYFIEYSGIVTVYDVNKKLVNTLQAPISWDGTDMNGNLLDAGYYILVSENEAPIYLTLVR